MLQVRLLGQFDIRMDGKRVTIPSRAGQSLLAYLMLTVGTAHRREKLAGILWPDTTDENARKNLRQELWRIRKAISTGQPAEKEYLLADEITLTFNRDSEYWLDVSQIEKRDPDLQALITNLALYQGDLLPGFYDEWVAIERERIQAIFEARMEQLLEQLIAAERWIAVQEWGERWLTLSGVREPAYRALMLASGVRGDMAKVAALYQRCTTELLQDLGVEPSAETRGLYDGLLKGAKIPQRTSAAQPSGTITFLFTDIEGSTRLLGKLGDQYAVALSEHHEILRAAIQKWNGHEVDTQGDAFFVTFTRALDAVQCAAEAQRTLAAHDWYQGENLRVRMGLHTGEPLIASTGYVGMDVHRAARIGDAGYGGQILLSPTTRELVLQDLPEGLTIQDLGEHRLKDMKYPASIYQLVMAGLPAEFGPIRTKFSGTESPTAGAAPFKGLQFFDVEDSDLFFGRETLTQKLMNRLHGANFLSVIIGASGSGKSSLVRAGLVPTLKKASANWQVHILTPTAHPLEALAIALTDASESVTAAATLMDDLSKDPRSLHFFLSRQAQTHNSLTPSHTLLVIDQFEELFTLCRDEFEREAFIDNLLAAISSSPLKGEGRGEGHLTLIITLRADFYAHLAQYPELRDAVAQQQEYIGPMTTDDLRRAIEEPARRGHWEFEPGLVDLILRDVGNEPGALPLLSHALLETWQRRAGHRLTLKGYADAGGVHGAIAHTAESVYQNLSLSEQIIVRNILLRLTEFGEGTEDTRRRATLDELWSHAEDADQVRAVLNKLAEARLVTLSEDSAEVAHEALIREWPKLREWLLQDREGIILHRNVTEAAHEWELLERDAGSVYRGARLAQANEWSVLNPNALNAQERLFLDASNKQAKQDEQEREDQLQRELDSAKELAETERQSVSSLRIRNRVIMIVGSITLILAILAGSFGLQSNQNAQQAQKNLILAEQQRNAALNAQATADASFTRAESQRLAVEATNLLKNNASPELIALLSLRSMNMQYSPHGDAALASAAGLNYPRQIFTGHTDAVTNLAFSPDGTYIVTSSNDQTVRLWDALTGQQLHQFDYASAAIYHTEDILVKFSPDSQYVLTVRDTDAYYASIGMLWAVKTGEQLWSFSDGDGVVSVIFSQDGKQLMTTTHGGYIRIWDIQTGKVLRQSHLPSQSLLYLSDSGKYVITKSEDDPRVIQLWDLEKEPITKIQDLIYTSGISGVLQSVAISADDRYAIIGYVDGSVVLWEISTGQIAQTFTGLLTEVLCVAFSPDGTYVMAGGLDKTTLVWNAQTKAVILRLTNSASMYAVAFAPDGNSVLTGSADGTVQLWEVHSRPELPVFKDGLENTSISAVNYSPDGKFLATGGTHGLQVWEVATGRLQHTFIDSGFIKYGVKFSPDGRNLLSADWTSAVTSLWDARTGELLRQFVPPVYGDGYRLNISLSDVAFSPDGRFIAASPEGKYVVVWDQQSANQTKLLPVIYPLPDVDPIEIIRLAFAPDGKSIMTASSAGQVRFNDMQTGALVKKFVGKAGLHGAAFSPDGKYIATASMDKLAHLWDVETGKEIRQFVGHTDMLYSVTFSPDGKYLATASADGTARLWDIQTGLELRRFTGHTAGVINLAFSPVGNYLATVSADGTARLWDVDYHTTMQYLCSTLLRDFTPEERAQYNITDEKPTCPK